MFPSPDSAREQLADFPGVFQFSTQAMTKFSNQRSVCTAAWNFLGSVCEDVEFKLVNFWGPEWFPLF